MTTKTKAKVSIAIIFVCSIMLLVAIAGVCIALNKSYKFGGGVSFSSADIKATITNANISGGSVIGDGKMQQISVDGLIREANNLDSWTGVNFKIAKDSKDITIRFNIINHDTNKTLKISLGQISANMDNAYINVKIEGQDQKDKIAYIKRAKTNEQSEVIEESFKQIVITLGINDKSKDASISNFNLPIVLQNVDGYVISLCNNSADVDANTFVCTDINNTLISLDKGFELCGKTLTIANQSQIDFYYSFQTNNGTVNTYLIKADKNIVIPIYKDSNITITKIVKAN